MKQTCRFSFSINRSCSFTLARSRSCTARYLTKYVKVGRPSAACHCKHIVFLDSRLKGSFLFQTQACTHQLCCLLLQKLQRIRQSVHILLQLNVFEGALQVRYANALPLVVCQSLPELLRELCNIFSLPSSDRSNKLRVPTIKCRFQKHISCQDLNSL